MNPITPPADSERLIRALHAPSAFPHPVPSVQVVETHISWVLLTGEFAYKIKKPVDLGFLDFLTLERRRHFCREELRLNGRTAPQLYLDVVPVTGTPDAPRIGGDGEPIEYAVRMRQFPQEALLSELLRRGELTARHVDQLAAEVAALHRSAAEAPAGSDFGTPDRVWTPVAENFRHITAEELDAPSAATVQRLRAWCEAEFEGRREAFIARRRDGLVRECHGDLHLGNMLLVDGRVVVFDGIEFNDNLRWIDTTSDLAFAVMDLEDRGRPDFARRLLNAYLEQTGDYRAMQVLRYYLVYRALVRAKVARIRAHQADTGLEERKRLRDEFNSYLALAERYTHPPRALLVITHGPSGSGKTTATRALVESLGFVRVRSDVERKRLAGLKPLDRGGEALYTPNLTEDTYSRLMTAAWDVLSGGFPAVVDATFLRRSQREQFREFAGRIDAPLVILDFALPEAVLRERVARRAAAGTDVSDATPDVLARQLAERDPLGTDELPTVISFDGSEESLRAALTRIEEFRRP